MIRSVLILVALMSAGPACAQGFGAASAAHRMMNDDPTDNEDSPSVFNFLFRPKSAEPAPPAAQSFALPDPIMTPGMVDPNVDLSEICNGTTKHRRLPSTKICGKVFEAYSIPPGDRYAYECDHDVPVALGGSTVAKNLWPQPNAEAALKDRLEVEMQRRACVAFRTLTPADAAAVLAQEQHEIADDWLAAYRQYIVGPSATR